MEHPIQEIRTEGNKMNDDTVRLLLECSSGIHMAVSSIDDVQGSAADAQLRRTLEMSKQHHKRLGGRTKMLLDRLGSPVKDADSLARSMSWMKTNWKLMMKPSDATVADLITDGCAMGIKSLSRYCNQYPAASAEARSIAQELIDSEEQLTHEIRRFL